MFHTNLPGKSFINSEEYHYKVLGCWTGKNIGGTLGAPFEGTHDMLDVKFYTQDLKGNPVPNDDLDLQLIWLKAIEEYGLYNINERILGEYWLAYITGPWNEYGIAKFNLVNGLLPPLSGICNNEKWKKSNGAWIRSEIWACLFPGEPDEAAPFAWYDACVDHADDGIYAEIFTVTLESAAFVESNLRKLISYALARIPADSRVARSVKLVIDSYDAGEDWQTARNKVLKDSEDLGWFQAPANVAYTILGLLYGEGDFGKSICLSVNCGDDTDCTGATCGAVLGIINGRSGIPKEWIEPIGNAIKTVAVAPFRAETPQTLQELTNRIISCKKELDLNNPTLMRLTDKATVTDDKLLALLPDGTETANRVLSRSSNSLIIPLPVGEFKVEFERSPIVEQGEKQKLTLTFGGSAYDNSVFSAEWHLPEGWSISGGNVVQFMTTFYGNRAIEIELTAGDFPENMVYIPLTFRLSGRNYPMFGMIPFQKAGSVTVTDGVSYFQKFWDKNNHRLARIKQC